MPTIRFAGLGIAVGDAPEEVSEAAHYVTSVAGGKGAIREVVELILKNPGSGTVSDPEIYRINPRPSGRGELVVEGTADER